MNVMTKAVKEDAPRRGGRPSRAEAARIQDRILDSAAHHFFTAGYGTTSIEAIAATARISKRTFYDRFKNKADVFKAVVHRVIERMRPPASNVEALFDTKDIPACLRKLAPLILQAALSPEGLALHRLMVAEAQRFPELAAAASSEGARQEAVRRIADLLKIEVAAERFAVPDPAFAAEQFLQMLIALPQRRALNLAAPMTAAELKTWADNSVDMFIRACRS
jgi:AcrR family transcriptional regulator